MAAKPEVTIALPVFNGAKSMPCRRGSVLGQDYERIELLISDNDRRTHRERLPRTRETPTSGSGTHRQPNNVGLINNFEWTKQHARGSYLRWIGDNDAIAPSYVSRCLAEFRRDPHRVLVTTGLEYVTSEGIESTAYEPGPLGVDEPVVRVQEMLRLLNSNYQLLDPLYGLVRTDVAEAITHDRLLRGDEIYALKLALAGPWGHVPAVLGRRDWAAVPAAISLRCWKFPLGTSAFATPSRRDRWCTS